jgi:beta-1,4-mannosyl-glycoprotein beta-1,4-N-acetylglucosaminyltransferase
MLWIDTVMFNGEPILKTRLEYLSDHVDCFYICEQRYTHQGQYKDQLYVEKYKEWLEPYLNKIKIIIDETNYSGKESWDIENAQRNYSLTYILKDYESDKYIVSVCDCDEIPNWKSVIEKTDLYDKCTNGAVIMEQDLYYYNLNWKSIIWKRAFFLNDISVKKFHNFQIFRNEKGPITDSFTCGWHLSYFFPIADIRRKIESFAHKEFNQEYIKDTTRIMLCVQEGYNLYNLHERFQKNNTFNFPKKILDLHNTIIKEQQ